MDGRWRRSFPGESVSTCVLHVREEGTGLIDPAVRTFSLQCFKKGLRLLAVAYDGMYSAKKQRMLLAKMGLAEEQTPPGMLRSFEARGAAIENVCKHLPAAFHAQLFGVTFDM